MTPCVCAPQVPAEKSIEDCVVGELASKPWQYEGYSHLSTTWQAVDQRRRDHRRPSNGLLGVAPVDLSGHHEPTPVVGARVGQRPGHYCLALSIRPDTTVGFIERGIQTAADGHRTRGRGQG